MLESIFDPTITLNQAKYNYTKYSDKPLNFDKNKNIGFKLRVKEINIIKSLADKFGLKIFVLMRKNILKHGISKCESNQLQFKLINNELDSDRKINIDLGLLDKNILECRAKLEFKESLIDKYNFYPIYYEDFLYNKSSFFKSLINIIDPTIPDFFIDQISNQESYFKKVHSDNLKDFVLNYEELETYIKSNRLEKFI